MSVMDKLKNVPGLEKLTEKLDELNPKTFEKDPNEWKPYLDKTTKTGYAVVRLLPLLDDKSPVVKFYDYGFQGPGGQWYIEPSRESIGDRDPVQEHWLRLYSSGQKDEAKKYSRRIRYAVNAYVIQDKGAPENEGRVVKYLFGQKIYEKIQNAMSPKFEDDQAFNPFHWETGANFKIKAAHNGIFWNYDESEFDAPSVFLDGDEKKLEAVFGQLHDVHAYVDPENFKSYDDLKSKLTNVLMTHADADADHAPAPEPAGQPAPVIRGEEPTDDGVREVADRQAAGIDEDTMSWIQKLADKKGE